MLWGEILVGGLIVLTIIIFYFTYVHYARLRNGRTGYYGLIRTIKIARRVLIGLVVILVGVIGYDHFSYAAQSTQTTSAAKQHSNKVVKPKRHQVTTSHKKKVKKSTLTGKRAVYIVQHYYERTQTQTNVDQYQFLGKKRDDTESLVYEVGGFQNNTGQLQQIHDYEVHSDGKFDEIY